MSRLLLTTMLWHVAVSITLAQSASVFNHVVASTGNFSVRQGISYSYTVGEPVITTLTGGSRILTQGFHQPEHTHIVRVEEPSLADWNIEIFPNPATDVLNVRFSSEKGNGLRVTVVDLLGKIIVHHQVLSEPGGSQIECRDWQPGVYFLQLQDPVGSASATARIIRL